MTGEALVKWEHCAFLPCHWACVAGYLCTHVPIGDTKPFPRRCPRAAVGCQAGLMAWESLLLMEEPVTVTTVSASPPGPALIAPFCIPAVPGGTESVMPCFHPEEGAVWEKSRG